MNQIAIQSLRDIREFCIELSTHIDGVPLDDYLTNRPLQRIVERLLEIIGEATIRAENAEPDLRYRIPETNDIAGMRNRIAHGYDALSDEILWNAATNEAPRLLKKVEAMLEELDNVREM